MTLRIFLFTITFSLLFPLMASGQATNSQTSNSQSTDEQSIDASFTAKPASPSECSDNGLLENTKKQWWQLDRIRPNGYIQASQAAENSDSPAPYKWQWLVFQSYRDGNWEIYRQRPTLDPSGIPPERLTNHSAADVRPRANPDASKIAFVSNRNGSDDIYTMNIDGSNLARLTFGGEIDTMLNWSPDGTQILFVSNRNGNADLFIMDANGANQRALTTSAQDDIFPTWSPDGKQIAWVQMQDTDRRLWIMNSDGTQAHAITGPIRLLQNPVWLPSSLDIAFDYDSEDGDAYNEVGSIAIDGTNFRRTNVSNTFSKEIWVSGSYGGANVVTVTYISWTCPNRSLLGSYEIGTVAIVAEAYSERWDPYTSSMPDLRSQDIWPPVTTISNVPRHTRSVLLNPTWNGFDIGPSGIAQVNIEARTDENPTWLPWSGYIPSDQKLYFRSQGVDDAGNIESWPSSADGDAQTDPFNWLVKGNISDNRAVALPNYPVAIFPPPIESVKTDIYGRFVAYRRGDTAFTFDETTNIDMQGDASYIHYLAPSINILRNGSFEETLLAGSWLISDTSNISMVNTIKHHANKSIRIGIPCAEPCLEDTNINAIAPNENDKIAASDIVEDRQGMLHVLGIDTYGLPIYQSRNKDGTWNKPFRFANTASLGTLTGIVDTTGVLHAFWTMSIDPNVWAPQVYHSQLLADNTWSIPQGIGPGNSAKAIIDSVGNLHIVHTYTQSSCLTFICAATGIYHTFQKKTGEWSTPQQIWTPNQYGPVPTDFVMSRDQSGGINVLLKDYVNPTGSTAGIFEIKIGADGKSTPRQLLDLPENSTPQQIVQDSQGTQFLLVFDGSNNQSYLHSKTNHSNWLREPIWILKRAGGRLFVDKNDNIHVIGVAANLYALRDRNGNWNEPRILQNEDSIFFIDRILAATVGMNASIHVMQETSGNRYIRSSKKSTDTLDIPIHQTISIPATVHKPTLSFMYSIFGSNTDQTYFEITAHQGVSATQIFSTSESTAWKLGWVDMTPWSNQTVTLTFSLHQAQGDMIKTLYLDDISLGSWLTAKPESVSPDRIEVNETTQLIISGDNFIATPEVTLNGTKLSGVQWLDENRIAITPPSGLAAGIYDLFIQNPGATESVLTSAVRVGKQVYLPIIAK